MRFRELTLLLMLMVLALSGCRVTGEVENQAYVLVLGVDRLPGGALELTARVPQIGKGDKEGEAGSSYLVFSADGKDWSQAVEALEQITPRPINLSHIELLVASEKLAREADFARLITEIAETPHLYTNARFVVCEGSARSFIDGQETIIGTRLSSEIDAMLNHYAERGYVPDSNLAEAYYALNSIYGGATAIYGALSSDAQEAISLTEPRPFDGGEASPMKERYGGTALFSDGRMVGTLSADQTALLNLIRGKRIALPFECDGKRFTLTPEGGAARSVDIDENGAMLRIRLRFSSLDDICAEDARGLETQVAQSVVEVIQLCQSFGSDPFGFSEAAAAHFKTVPEWLQFDWQSMYVSASIQVEITIDTANAE